MGRIKKFFQGLLILIIVIAVVVGFGMVTINSHVQNKEKSSVVCAITKDKTSLLSSEISAVRKIDPDCIIILGAGIKNGETPSPMLKDRLDTGIMLYKMGIAPKILLSGDNGTVTHNEIHVMLRYTLKAGVPSADIFCDHAGFSTYDSMYRAQSIFKVKSAVIVTQTYHMYRSLYIADKLGIKALGISSDQKKYRGQAQREMREVLARNKDFFKVMVKPKSKVGGSAIPISGSGEESHGE